MDYFEYLKNNPSAVKKKVKGSDDIVYVLNGYRYFNNGRRQNLETNKMSNYMPRDMDNSAFITKMENEDYAGYNAIEYADGGLELYISFKSLLEWTNININMFSEGVEVIKIDFDLDKPMFMYSTTISTNLQKCYVRNPHLNTTKGTFKDTQPPFKDIDEFDSFKLQTLKNTLNTLTPRPDSTPGPYTRTTGEGQGVYIYPTMGNINNIYLNAIYISEQLKKLSDNESNKVSVAKFLQELCNGVNKALGSINDLQVVGDVDGEQNTLTIVDFQQTRIKRLSNINEQKKVTTINAQGLKSMVTSISAQSSITPELATMISIGAQASGEALGQEAVAFQKLNTGLLDRVYPTRGISAEEVKKQEVAAEKREERAKSKFNENLKIYTDLINNQKPIPGDFFGPVTLKADDSTNIENIPVELYKYLLGQFTQTNQTATGFIPIKLDLTLYGISGIKIFQKFKITKDILPFSYDQDYEFTITGVSHAVDGTKWSTSITSIMGLAEKDPIEAEAFRVMLNFKDREYASTPSGPATGGSAQTRPAKSGIKCNTVTKGTTKFEDVLKLVIDNLEGSYSKGGADAGSANSGQTLWGLDQKNHKGTLDNIFWAKVAKTPKKGWNNFSFPKPKDAPNLYKDYVPILKKDYNDFKKEKNKDVIKIIEGDGRLFFHMVYAVFNGAGWFNGFYKVIEQAYKSGTTDPEELLKISVNERISGAYNAYRLGTGSSNLGIGSANLLANTGVDIEKLVGISSECTVA